MSSKFTRKHYEAIASIIKQNKIYLNNEYLFCRAFGILLEDDNEKFDTERFLKACGVIE